MSHPTSPPGEQPQYGYPDGGYQSPPPPENPSYQVTPPASAPPGPPVGQPAFGGQPAPVGPPPGAGYPPAPAPVQPSFTPGAAPVSGYPNEPVSGYGGDGNYAPPNPAMPPTGVLPQVGGATMGMPPISGLPVGQPSYVGAPAPGPAPAKRGVVTPVLSGLLALALIAAVTMTVMFMNESGDLDKANQTIRSRDTALTDKDAEIKQLNEGLQSKQDELDRAKQNLSGSQNQNAELKRQKDVIRQCIVLLGEAQAYADKADWANYNKTKKESDRVCDEAVRYLAS